MIKIPDHPFAYSVEELLSEMGTDAKNGLSEGEVIKRREAFGENRLKKGKRKPLAFIFLEQFLDPVIYVLIFANVLAFIFGDLLDGMAISVVILITVLIGFLMEWQAIRSMEALRKMARVRAHIVRSGRKYTIPAEELVPGDVVLLEMGDVVPADARLMRHQKLAVKESILTGESDQVDKQTEPLSAETPLPERYNMVYKGTLVTRGAARALVVATGMHTELGKISRLTQETESERTPLQKKLAVLSKRLIGITLILVFFIALSGFVQGADLRRLLETAVALAVAAIPEGLPIVATIALARGMLKMAKRKVIIKRLESVQTLGEAAIICTDKTGTLTENEMSVQVVQFDDHLLEVPKTGMSAFFQPYKSNPAFDRMVKVGILCNNADPAEKKGDPIEIALLEFAGKTGCEVSELRKQHKEVFELPFDTERKMMATINEAPEGYWLCVKGALEAVIEQCSEVLKGDQPEPLEDKQSWMDKADRLAARGMRVLAFAYHPSAQRPDNKAFAEQLVLLGLVGFWDPPRRDVSHAIQTCRHAGIRVVMITGDHPVTARKIAEDIGLLTAKDQPGLVVKGSELLPYDQLGEKEKNDLLKATVFARVTPAQKLDLVKLYQNNNNTVGMTGDGVNDAPALKKADIGIAMGIRGAEAAKEVADVILQDDSFNAIELAIRQGRIIFENIRNFVVYLLSCNLAEIIAVALASLVGWPAPLLPLQILFLNLVTDVFPALALGFGEGETDIMEHPPKKNNEPILTAKHWRDTFL